MAENVRIVSGRKKDTFHFHLHVPDYVGRRMLKIMKRDNMLPSQFFRRLFDEASMAKVPLLDGEKERT